MHAENLKKASQIYHELKHLDKMIKDLQDSDIWHKPANYPMSFGTFTIPINYTTDTDWSNIIKILIDGMSHKKEQLINELKELGVKL